MLNSLLIATSFLAGLLTILAPCVLPLLSVVIGSTAGSENRKKPIIVVISLAISIITFTLLLKASSALINVPQQVWLSIAGGIVLIFGIFLLLPEIWEFISIRLRLGQKSQEGLSKAEQHDSIAGSILIGAALGPVFSSCSPTYFVILATVLPVSFAAGVFYLIIYALGVAVMLGLIAYFGQRLISHLGWAADPKGWFKRLMGLLLILVGLAVITGYEKKIETAILDAGFGTTNLEERLLDKVDMEEMMGVEKKVEEAPDTSVLPMLFMAPELQGVENWINSGPISSMQELKGKVVLIDFWTYSCINCIRTLPYLQAWHERYADEGLVIIGVHAPEFQFEQKLENVQKAVKDYGLTYAVVQDNNFKLWRAYSNRYWPAKYLIDQNGVVRYKHFGEGEYDETEEAIVALLRTDMKKGKVEAQAVDFKKIGTRETYIGTQRRKNYMVGDRELKNGQWTLTGDWKADGEKAVSQSADASIKMKFTASKANLVMSGIGQAEVFIDGEKANAGNSGQDVKNGLLTFNGERLYELTDFGMEYGTHDIEIRFREPGAALYVWTFG